MKRTVRRRRQAQPSATAAPQAGHVAVLLVVVAPVWLPPLLVVMVSLPEEMEARRVSLARL